MNIWVSTSMSVCRNEKQGRIDRNHTDQADIIIRPVGDIALKKIANDENDASDALSRWLGAFLSSAFRTLFALKKSHVRIG